MATLAGKRAANRSVAGRRRKLADKFLSYVCVAARFA